MSIAIRNEVIDPPNLAELAETINREHGLSFEATMTAVEHAIIAGEALLDARTMVEAGDWYAWLDANTTFSRAYATAYLRMAHYKDLVREAPSVDAARRILVGKPDVAPRGVRRKEYEWVDDARKMRLAGATQDQIAEVLGVSQAAVCLELNPQARAKNRESHRRYAARRRAERKALKREQRDAAARRAGGGISDCYSRIRIAAESLDALGRDGATEEVRRHANAALLAVYRAEEEIVKILGLS